MGWVIVIVLILIIVAIKKKRPSRPKSYPIFQYLSENIMTKKARKQYNTFVVIDFETTGLNPARDNIIEIGAAKICDGTIVDIFSTLVNPGRSIPAAATKINGITNRMVRKAPLIKDVLPKFLQFIGNDVLVAHNAPFDLKFLMVNAYECGYEIKNPVIDTLPLCRKLYPNCPNHKLGTVSAYLGIELEQAHRSLADVIATANILIKSIALLNKQDEIKDNERKQAKLAKTATENG